MKQKTAKWLEYARRDLDAASLIFASGREDMMGIVGFLCQQAVEKALKGALVEADVEPPRTHDIEELVTRCGQASDGYSGLPPGLSRLTPFAVEVRYPSDLPSGTTKEQAFGFLAMAAQVLDLVSREVGGS